MDCEKYAAYVAANEAYKATVFKNKVLDQDVISHQIMTLYRFGSKKPKEHGETWHK